MIATDLRTHVAWIPRATAERMLQSAQTREHFARTAAGAGRIHPYIEYLRAALARRGDKIELRGPSTWFALLVAACGDAPAALEIGMQLERD